MSKNYDAWCLKSTEGNLLPWWVGTTRSGLIKRIDADTWKRLREAGNTLVKVKLVEVGNE